MRTLALLSNTHLKTMLFEGGGSWGYTPVAISHWFPLSACCTTKMSETGNTICWAYRDSKGINSHCCRQEVVLAAGETRSSQEKAGSTWLVKMPGSEAPAGDSANWMLLTPWILSRISLCCVFGGTLTSLLPTIQLSLNSSAAWVSLVFPVIWGVADIFPLKLLLFNCNCLSILCDWRPHWY